MITVRIDDKAAQRAFREAPTRLAVEISKEVRIFIGNGTSDFTRKNLSAKDDRNQSDFLLRRPPSSKGLRRATGSLSRELVATNTPIVADLKTLYAKVGFRTGRGARIARVHELGTIRYGGSLPDIVPKRANYLAIPIRKGTVSRGTKVLGIARLLKVGIPPRLGFVAFWSGPAKVKELQKRVAAAAGRALKAAARRA